MLRSQLYVLTYVIVMIIIFGILDWTALLNKSLYIGIDQVNKLLTIFYIKKENKLLFRLFRFKNTVMVPFYVYYPCGEEIEIPNPFRQATVLTQNLTPIRTCSGTYISFTPPGTKVGNYCFFMGYIVNISLYKCVPSGTLLSPANYTIYMNNRIYVNDLLKLINYIQSDVTVEYLNNSIRYYNSYLDIILGSG